MTTPTITPDRDWALNMYSAFARGGDDERLLYQVVEGDPWSKSRPKFSTRGRHVVTYQPDDDKAAEARMRASLRGDGTLSPFLGNVMLACRFYRSNFQRIDADNLLKHVCDSANGVLWVDDSQATLVMGEVLYDPERPRTIVVAGNHRSNLLRGDDRNKPCAHCGELFLPSAGGHSKRFCGRACTYAARAVTLAPITCPQCLKEFRPTTSRQKLCSQPCAVEHRRGALKAKAAPSSRCTACGKQLTHTRGGRCRDCWRADPGFYPATPADAAAAS